MNLIEFESQLNQWGRTQVPFLFLADFEMENLLAWKIKDVPKDILVSINGFSNTSSTTQNLETASLTKNPVSFSNYKSKFDLVQERIRFGDSYLTNLTIKTKININCSLEELFSANVAKYQLCWKNKFLVFSPETFVQIRNKKIYSFPMKGTIDASLPHAEQIILSDQKEL